ncbi:MAG: UvrD-helicase domain-containing protein [Chrysiogenales bacterium]
MENSILKLEASAGSGKTYRLALEYIGRLLQMFAELDKKPDNFKGRQKALGSILAITFTVKAAQEMKSRIIEKLKNFALSTAGRQMSAADQEFLEELAQATGLDENKIIVISGHLIETILASYDDFKKDISDRSLIGSFWKILLSA